MVRWRLALAPPRFDLLFLWMGFFVLEQAGVPHLGVAALVGPTELCGMVDPHVELVFAQRAVRHASAATTIFSTMLGCPELWGSRTCPS